jgi:hypothetical protein
VLPRWLSTLPHTNTVTLTFQRPATVTLAAKGTAKAAKEPKAPKAATKKEIEPPAAAAGAPAGEEQHVTPNLGITVTLSVLPDSRRRLRVRGTRPLRPHHRVLTHCLLPPLVPSQAQIPVSVLKTSYEAVLQELGEGAT